MIHGLSEKRAMAGRKIVLFGAFDRFNYGDVLFPIIFYELCKERCGISGIECVGLRQSNLGRFGGFPTKPASFLGDGDNLPDGSVIVVVGGELIGQSWAEMHGSLVPVCMTPVVRQLSKSVQVHHLDQFSRRYFAADWEWPYVIGPDDFRNDVSIAYNAVGALSLARRSKSANEKMHRILSAATFLSVRDAESQRLLNKYHDIAELFPDSAMLVSKLFPKEKLLGLVSAETRRILHSGQRGHVCFQISDAGARGHIDVIAEQLDRLHSKVGLQTVLLPIGRAAFHADQVALRKIKKRMKSPAALPRPNGVYDIMALLAHAKVVVGTSLHGVITGMSYGVPYVALGGIDKLEIFLKTWSIDALNRPVKFDDVVEAVDNAMSVDVDSLVRQGSELGALTEQGTASLLQAALR